MLWDGATIESPLFADRREAGRLLAAAVEGERSESLVVVGLARGGVVVAAEVAQALAAPLDVVAVRKIGHPCQPEYGIGALTPGGGVFVRGPDGLTEEELAGAVAEAKAKAALLDERLHAAHRAVTLAGRTVLLVDDGLATGATMIAALRWAASAGATRRVAAVPVGPAATVELIRPEADGVVCLHTPRRFFSVGAWYETFQQVDDAEVVRLLGERRPAPVT